MTLLPILRRIWLARLPAHPVHLVPVTILIGVRPNGPHPNTEDDFFSTVRLDNP